MTELIGHLGPAGPIVLFRARLLPSSLKILWLQDYYLDLGPDGSFMTAPVMADRIGLSASIVDKGRRLLCHLELMTSRKGRGRGDYWYPVLPAAAVPVDRKESQLAVLRRHQEALDVHIRHRAAAVPPSFFSFREWIEQPHRAGWGRPTGNGGTDPPGTVTQTHRDGWGRPAGNGGSLDPIGGAASGEGGKGGFSTPTSSERAVSPPRSTTAGEIVLTNGTPGEKRVREKRGQPARISRTGQAILDRFQPPPRVAGES